MSGFDVGLDRLLLGVFAGLTYGLLAVGLVLVYRSSRFVNFAHGSIGAFGASVLALLVADWGLPYWAAFPVAIALAAGVAGLVEVGVVRRLAGRPSLIGMIATLGLSQFILVLALVINTDGVSGFTFPEPQLMPTLEVGTLELTPPYVAMLVLGPVLLVGLSLFLRRHRLGMAMRAAADDPDGAQLAGIRATRMTTLAWAIAGGVAAFSAILVTPTTAGQSIDTLGPDLLLKGLAGAVIARMASIPVAVSASIGIGVLEQVLLSNPDTRSLVPVALMLVIAIALLRQPALGRAGAERSGWRRIRPTSLPEEYRAVRSVRLLDRGTALAVVALAVGVGFLVSNETASVLTAVAGFALVGLSVGLVTGVAGQLSLGQFAYAGIGAATAVHAMQAGLGFLPGVLVGVGAAALASTLVGIPALRLKGLALGVCTLAFALATSAWLLRLDLFLGDGLVPPTPRVLGRTLDLASDYYLFALAMLALGIWVTGNLRRSGFGRSLQALRDNEEAGRAMTVPARRRKLQLYAVSGGLAGLGGIVIGFGQTTLTVNTFPAAASIDVVALAVVGGLGLVGGPVIGAALIIGLPALAGFGLVGHAALALGWLLVVVLLPDGLGGLLVSTRHRVADRLAARAGLDVEALRHRAPAPSRSPLQGRLEPAARREDQQRPPPSEDLLIVTGLTRRFGGVVAVDGADLDVRRGEILGIIGPNGAGKTTLFEMIAGFTRPHAGEVWFDGRDVTRATPEQRAAAGLVRSFQDAALFATLTVRETLMLAQERTDPTTLWAAALGTPTPEQRKGVQAEELLDRMGLRPYAEHTVSELSTGTRRVVELACLLSLEPRVLLLDEPSAGIAQGESRALGDLLLSLRDDLGITMVVIEHDLPLLGRLCDRLVAMDLGQVVAKGTPEEVRAHPAVVRSYLGTEHAAIHRSGDTAVLEPVSTSGPVQSEPLAAPVPRDGRNASIVP